MFSHSCGASHPAPIMAHNNRLLSPLRGWDGLSAASRLQVRPKAGRYEQQVEL
jgi:hypothetical protein